MRRVTPSQLVKSIDEYFPEAKNRESFEIHFGRVSQVKALIKLIDSVPQELMPFTAEQFSLFVLNIEGLKDKVDRWSNEPTTVIKYFPSTNGLSPIVVIRDLFNNCSDEAETALEDYELKFISNDELRKSIRRDIDSSHKALREGLWKMATVFFGASIEAILLDVLSNYDQNKIIQSCSNLKISKSLNDLGLGKYIELVKELNIIDSQDTLSLLKMLQNYRNLIHPGRQIRKSAQCDLSTASIGVAALHQVINKLK